MGSAAFRDGPGPDLTLLLLPPLKGSLDRARRRNARASSGSGSEDADENRFELEQDGFYQRAWAKYREIAAREPGRVVAIEGELTIDEVHERVIAAVSERLVAASY